MRGPRPASIEDVKSLGCKTVIDLELGWADFFYGKPYEAMDDSSILIRHIPLGDIFPPTEAEVRGFLAMVDFSLQRRGSVYFHCLHGKDRTGYMAAQYRIRVQGWAPINAVDEMLSLGFHRWFYWHWIRKILNY